MDPLSATKTNAQMAVTPCAAKSAVGPTVLNQTHALSEYINERFKKIAAPFLAPGEEIPQVLIYGQKGQGINAYACCHGKIYVTPELLDQLNFVEELDALLMHEFAHLFAKHFHNPKLSESGLDLVSRLRSSEYEADTFAFYALSRPEIDSSPRGVIKILKSLRSLEHKGKKVYWDIAHGDISNRIAILEGILRYTEVDRSKETATHIMSESLTMLPCSKSGAGEQFDFSREVARLLKKPAAEGKVARFICCPDKNLTLAELTSGKELSAKKKIQLLATYVAQEKEKLSATPIHPQREGTLIKLAKLINSDPRPTDLLASLIAIESLSNVPLFSSTSLLKILGQQMPALKKQVDSLAYNYKSFLSVLQSPSVQSVLSEDTERTAFAEILRHAIDHFAILEKEEQFDMQAYSECLLYILRQPPTNGYWQGGSADNTVNVMACAITIILGADAEQQDKENQLRQLIEVSARHCPIFSDSYRENLSECLHGKLDQADRAVFVKIMQAEQERLESKERELRNKLSATLAQSKPTAQDIENLLPLLPLLRALNKTPSLDMHPLEFLAATIATLHTDGFAEDYRESLKQGAVLRAMETLELLGLLKAEVKGSSHGAEKEGKSTLFASILKQQPIDCTHLDYHIKTALSRLENLFSNGESYSAQDGLKIASNLLEHTSVQRLLDLCSIEPSIFHIPESLESYGYAKTSGQAEQEEIKNGNARASRQVFKRIGQMIDKAAPKGIELLKAKFDQAFFCDDAIVRQSIQIPIALELVQKLPLEESLNFLFESRKHQLQDFITLDLLKAIDNRITSYKDTLLVEERIGLKYHQLGCGGIAIAAAIASEGILQEVSFKNKLLECGLLFSSNQHQFYRQLVGACVTRRKDEEEPSFDIEAFVLCGKEYEGFDEDIERFYKTTPIAKLAERLCEVPQEVKIAIIHQMLIGQGGALWSKSSKEQLIQTFLKQQLEDNSPEGVAIKKAASAMFNAMPIDKLALRLSLWLAPNFFQTPSNPDPFAMQRALIELLEDRPLSRADVNPHELSRAIFIKRREPEWNLSEGEVSEIFNSIGADEDAEEAEGKKDASLLEPITRGRLIDNFRERYPKDHPLSDTQSCKALWEMDITTGKEFDLQTIFNLACSEKLAEMMRQKAKQEDPFVVYGVPHPLNQRTEEKASAIQKLVQWAGDLGSLPVRSLQIAPHLISFSADIERELSVVYDRNEGQSTLAAIRSAIAFLPEGLKTQVQTGQIERLAGGSLYTVLKLTNPGMPPKVLKVLNPQALADVEEIKDVLESAIAELAKDEPDYLKGQIVLNLVEKWIVSELSDVNYEVDDPRAKKEWEQFNISSPLGLKIKVPLSENTGTLKVLVEEFVEGYNFTELDKFSPQIQKELVEFAARFLARQVEGSSSGNMMQWLAAKAGIQKDVIVQSDFSPGNVRFNLYKQEVYPIDRVFSQHLTFEDRLFLRKLLASTNPKDAFESTVEHIGKDANLPRIAVARAQFEKLTAGTNVFGSTCIVKIFQSFTEAGIEIPLKFHLLLKNAKALERMQLKVQQA